MDPLALLAGSGDDAALARNMQDLFGEQGFNPMALFAGEIRYLAVFIAPLPPAVESAVARLMHCDDGPLLAMVEQFTAGGMAPVEARAKVKELFSAAQGMCVVVLVDDQGPSIAQQLYFGHLDEAYRAHVAGMFREDFPGRDPLAAGLLNLRHALDHGRRWPDLVAAADGDDDPRRFWPMLAAHIARSHEEGIVPNAARMGDLPWWVAVSMVTVEGASPLWDADARLNLTRTCLIGSDIEAGCHHLACLLAAAAVDDETLAEILDLLAAVAVTSGQPAQAALFFVRQAALLDEVLGGCWELAFPRFRVLAAAMAPLEDLMPAAEALQAADRKAFRHAMHREPLWRVRVNNPGELLDTQAAAELLDRSTTFVAKRLEQGTIPSFRQDDAVRIPRLALERWKAVMDHFELLD